MKNIKFLMILLLTVLMFLISGCSDDGAQNSHETKTDLVDVGGNKVYYDDYCGDGRYYFYIYFGLGDFIKLDAKYVENFCIYYDYSTTDIFLMYNKIGEPSVFVTNFEYVAVLEN